MSDILTVATASRRPERLGAAPEKVRVIPYGVDHCFFSPVNEDLSPQKDILSLGETRTRNYAYLFEAVKGLPVEVWVAA